MPKPQQVYFRGMRLALQQYPARYRAQPIDDDALVGGLIRAEVGQRAAAVADRVRPRSDFDDTPAKERESVERAKPASTISVPPSARASAPPDQTRIGVLGDKLRLKRAKEGARDAKTARQATRLYALFERFLAQECGIHALEALRQTHLAQFINFIQFEDYTHYGKSAADEARTITELRQIGSEAERGVEAPTLNRHLAFINQLFEYARSGRGPQHGIEHHPVARSQQQG